MRWRVSACRVLQRNYKTRLKTDLFPFFPFSMWKRQKSSVESSIFINEWKDLPFCILAISSTANSHETVRNRILKYTTYIIMMLSYKFPENIRLLWLFGSIFPNELSCDDSVYCINAVFLQHVYTVRVYTTAVTASSQEKPWRAAVSSHGQHVKPLCQPTVASPRCMAQERLVL